MELETKRGRGKTTRGGRGRPRGRGRGRGKKCEKVVSDEEIDSVVLAELGKENECESEAISNSGNLVTESENVILPEEEQQHAGSVIDVPIETQTILPTAIDMEADISQLEAPTFTTLSRGPPEPMLRLKWSHKVNLIGEKVLNPMIHCCDQCEKPILIYGRMIPCKHIFCLKCARTEPIKICPRCNDKVVRVEQSGLGTVFLCTHGGSRYGNTGCRRTYLSQRDLQAHINHRHMSQLTTTVGLQQPQAATITLPPPLDTKPDALMETHKLAGSTRKLSESSTGANLQSPSALLNQRNNQIRNASNGIGSIPPPGAANAVVGVSAAHSHSALTAANLARVNNANAQECHQGKERLHQTLKKTPITQSHHQPPETVADASYYSSVLNSFGAAEGNTERSVRKY